ncbi:hypothetical protein P9X10_02365 [Bacillus cereus]|nr:hypothetical protein [Bacillus cereus]
MSLKKVTLTQVKSAVKRNGSWTGYIAPNKVSEFSVSQGFHLGAQIVVLPKDGGFFVGGQYELGKYLENFQYHNCNSEVGTRVAYWEVIN